MKERLSRNYASVMASEIFSYLIPLILTPYLSRVLGAGPLGDYHFTAGIVSYFILAANLGITNYAKRETAFRQNNIQDRSQLFTELFLFRMITATLATIAYVIFIIFFAGKYQRLYVIQLLTFLSAVLDITWLFHGMENYRSVVLRNAVIRVIGAALVFILVQKPEDLWVYVLLTGLTTLLCSLSLWPSMRKYIVWPRWKDIHIRSHIKGVLTFFASTVAVQLYTVLDQTMLGVISGTTEVGYYAQGQKIIRMGLMLTSSLAVVLLPRIAVLYQEKQERELKSHLSGTFDYLFALSVPMAVGCFVVAPDFVPVFFGEEFLPVVQLLRILSFLFCVLGLGQILGTLLSAIDQQPKSTIAVTLGAVINIVLNSILIRNLNSVGACIASVAAEAVVTTAEILFINRYLGCGKQIFRSFVHYLFPSLFMGAAVLAVHYLIDGEAWLGIIKLITELMVGVLVYALVLAFTKDPILDRIFPVRMDDIEEGARPIMERLGIKRLIKGLAGAVPVCVLLTICLEIGLAFLHRSGTVEKHFIHFAILMLGAEGMVLLYGMVPGLRSLWIRIDRKFLTAESRKPWVDIAYAVIAALLLLHHFYVMLNYPRIPAGGSRLAPVWIPFAVVTVMLGKLWRNKGFWIGAVLAAYMFERTYLKNPNLSGETMVYMVSAIYSLVICYGAFDVIRPEYRKKALGILCAIWTVGMLAFSIVGIYVGWTGTGIQNLAGGYAYIDTGRLYLFAASTTSSGMICSGVLFALIGFAITKNIAGKLLYLAACLPMLLADALTDTRAGFVMLSFAAAGVLTLGIWGIAKRRIRTGKTGNVILAIGLAVCMAGSFLGMLYGQQQMTGKFVEIRDKGGMILSSAQAEENGTETETSRPAFVERDLHIEDISSIDRLLSGRPTIWKKAFRYAQEHPEVYAIGMSADGSVRTAIDQEAHCHNILVQNFMEGGIPGIALFIGLLAYFLWQACRLWRRWELPLWQRALPLPALAVMIMEMAECLTHFSFGHVPMTVLYFFIGTTVVVSKGLEKETKGKHAL